MSDGTEITEGGSGASFPRVQSAGVEVKSYFAGFCTRKKTLNVEHFFAFSYQDSPQAAQRKYSLSWGKIEPYFFAPNLFSPEYLGFILLEKGEKSNLPGAHKQALKHKGLKMEDAN